MKKYLYFILAATLMAACSDDSLSVPEDHTNENTEGSNDGADASVYEKIDWNAAADSCTFTLTDSFLDKETGTFWGSRDDIKGNSGNLYWQQAHAMDVVVYSYERIKDTDPKLAKQYETYFELWYRNKANNWYNWAAKGDRTGFLNEFTDDMNWIVLTLMRLTEATGKEKYFNTAKQVYDDYIRPRAYEDELGFGLPWKDNDHERNECTESSGCLAAVKLYEKTGEEHYLDDAKKIHQFCIDNLINPDDWAFGGAPLSYNNGSLAEADRRLYHITGEEHYLNAAEQLITYILTSGRSTKNGILRDESTGENDENNSIFKAVFCPHAATLALDKAARPDIRKNIKELLLKNAYTLWVENMDRSLYPRMYANRYWGELYPASSYPDRYPGSLGAHTSGASLLEAVARMMNQWEN